MTCIRRLALIATALTATGLTFAGAALADDSHHTCTNTVACTGHIIDLHDITLDNVVVRALDL